MTKALICKCGKPARPNQRDCLTCHAISVHNSRKRKEKLMRERIEALERVIDQMTVRNALTQALYEERFKDRCVTIEPGPGTLLPMAGIVVGFLPGSELLVQGYDGLQQHVPLSRLAPDNNRKGEQWTKTNTDWSH